MNKLMIDTTIEVLVYSANIVAKTQETKVGFVGYAKSLSKGLVKMMCMEVVSTELGLSVSDTYKSLEIKDLETLFNKVVQESVDRVIKGNREITTEVTATIHPQDDSYIIKVSLDKEFHLCVTTSAELVEPLSELFKRHYHGTDYSNPIVMTFVDDVKLQHIDNFLVSILWDSNYEIAVSKASKDEDSNTVVIAVPRKSIK